MIAAAQLLKTTESDTYRNDILASRSRVVAESQKIAWAIAPVVQLLHDEGFERDLREAVRRDYAALEKSSQRTRHSAFPTLPISGAQGGTSSDSASSSSIYTRPSLKSFQLTIC